MTRGAGVELSEDGALDVDVLGHRFDDNVRIPDGFGQAAGERDASRSSGGFRRGDAPGGYQAAQALSNARLGLHQLCCTLVLQADVVAVGGELEGDAVPHQAGPDHGDAAYRRRVRHGSSLTLVSPKEGEAASFYRRPHDALVHCVGNPIRTREMLTPVS
jgi:hypothetical protein